jgi:stringent starvation protein B
VAERLISTKPYMVRAIHEWCVDNGLTPHLLVTVNAQCRVPAAYIKDGEIVLNLNYTATKDLHIDNEAIVFSARFGGVSQNLYVPMDAVKGVFARENGQGMFFENAPQANSHAAAGAPSPEAAAPESSLGNNPENNKVRPQKKKPTLTIVK